MPINYQESKIYKLVNSDNTLCYVGSTTQPLSKRKAEHHSSFKCWQKKRTKYLTSFKLFENNENDVDIVLIENYPCSNKEELHKRERYYIDLMECVNKNKPTRTQKEWLREHLERVTKINMKNITVSLTEHPSCGIFTCECGKIFTLENKQSHDKSVKHIKYLEKMNQVK